MEEPRSWREAVDEMYSDVVEQFYDDGLDAVLDESLHPRGPDVLFDIAGELGVGTDSEVLDVGCRDGSQMVELQRRFGCRATGVEPAPANLARLRPEEGSEHLSVARAVAEALPFRDASFDLVWVRDVLVHVESLPAAFTECRRVLRAGRPMLVFHVFATPLLEPAEATRLWQAIAVVPGSADRVTFENAATGAGFRVERREELHGEWRELAEERGDRRTSRQLLRVARMLRSPERFRARIGDRPYDVELGNCLYGVYQLLGKLSAAIYVLR